MWKWMWPLLAACAAEPEIVCGPGTVADGDSCVATGPSCGPGTHDEDGACVADDRFEIRTSMIVADGYSRSDVRVFAYDASGEAVQHKVVLSADRPTSGVFVSPTIYTGDLGGATTFLPCNSIDPGCVGPATFRVALANAPDDVVAETTVELVAPPPVGSIAACMAGGNILHVEGHNFFYDAPVTLTDGTFDLFGSTSRGVVNVVPADLGAPWSFEFHTMKMGMPMIRSVYRDADMTWQTPAGSSFMSIRVPEPTHSTCGEPVGAFQIHAFTAMPNDVTLMTASFELRCPDDPSRYLTGCVHVTR